MKFLLFVLLATQLVASKTTWQTLNGDPPLIIARGGFSGLLPDSSVDSYGFVSATSVPDAVMWCDVQLTKDGTGICFPDVTMNYASSIQEAYPERKNSYLLNGVPTQDWFTIDFTFKDLTSVFLTQGNVLRTRAFNDNRYAISTVQNIATKLKPEGFWLNVQNDAFYTQQNLSMSSFLLTVSKIDYLSSPEVNFFRNIGGRFGKNGPKFVFRFLEEDAVEVSTNQTYGTLLRSLTFIKTFASGVLVPKSYIWPVDEQQYLLPHTSFVQDAHKAGLEVYASGFANDIRLPYNYSFDPLSEYLSFIDNGDFSVDGLLSDFPPTASSAVDCFSHLGNDATTQVDFLVISKNGASGDYTGCTDLAYSKAIQDGADVIDCNIQMSSDGIPFCLGSYDLSESTNIFQSNFRNRSTIVDELVPYYKNFYSFSLAWSEIQTLTPSIKSPYNKRFRLVRNPKERSYGKLLSLSDFLNLAKNSSSLTGVLIIVENAAYLREKQGLDVVKAALDTLTEAGYSNATTTTKKVMIQSTSSSVLIDFKKQSRYETVYRIDETIRDVLDSAIEDIKRFADAVVIEKKSVFPVSAGDFTVAQTALVQRLQSFQLPVYVGLFQNEFVSKPWDFFSDSYFEIHSYVAGVGINGTVTEFPLTAVHYKRNRCLARNPPPPYMIPVHPGGLLAIMSPFHFYPQPFFTDADVAEPPLPPVTARAPTTIPGPLSTDVKSSNGQTTQTRVALSLLLSAVLSLLL